jgi:pimeloyl-ACP methyl ester carboxylesterase
MVPFEVSIAILNHIADWRLVLLNNCGHWPPFEKPAEWAAQVLAFHPRCASDVAFAPKDETAPR